MDNLCGKGIEREHRIFYGQAAARRRLCLFYPGSHAARMGPANHPLLVRRQVVLSQIEQRIRGRCFRMVGAFAGWPAGRSDASVHPGI